MIGKTLGHYQPIAKIGEGRMGVVYKSYDPHLGRFVALKSFLLKQWPILTAGFASYRKPASSTAI